MPLDARARRQDVLFGAGIGVGTLISASLLSVTGLYSAQDSDVTPVLVVVYALVLGVGLALRRRYPASIAVIIAVAFFGAGSLHVPELYTGNIAMFIAFYTVGAVCTDRRRAAGVRAAITIGMFIWLLTATFIEATQPAGDDGLSRAGAFSPFLAFSLLNILINVLYFGGAYYFGERAWMSAQQRLQLEQRTAELERERERTSAQAVALERVRIARELHDVVAHHVSLMGVQAGAARAVMTRDPDAAAATLAQVEASARTAIDELHNLLQTLREDESEPTASTVGLAAIGELAAESTRAGVPTALTVIGDERDVPDTVQVALYRIAQEALTNARRHGGAQATADVRVRYGEDGVEVEVTNTGRAAGTPSRGLGLVGMRERAAAAGGTLEALARTEGGFLVRASVPLSAREKETTDA